jgi:hypothetical protein
MIVCCDRLPQDWFDTFTPHFQVDYSLNIQVRLFLLDLWVLSNSEVVFKQTYLK